MAEQDPNFRQPELLAMSDTEFVYNLLKAGLEDGQSHDTPELDRLLEAATAPLRASLAALEAERDRLRAVVAMYLEEDGDPSLAGGNAFVRHVCHSAALREAARAALAGLGAGEGRADG